MSSTPVNPPSSGSGLLQEIFGIIQIAAGAAAGFLPGGAQAVDLLVSALAAIAQKASAAYQAQTGQPLDLTQIPPEARIPEPPPTAAPAPGAG